jgi:ABC-type multidrug transport system fused ATPase/permease subunit
MALYFQLIQAKSFASRRPSQILQRCLDFVRYIITIVTSSYTLATMIKQGGGQLLILNALKTMAHVWRLMAYHGPPHTFLSNSAISHRYEVTNQSWHRLNTVQEISLNNDLRRDVKVTGIEPWLMSEMHASQLALGDTPTTPPYMQRQAGFHSFTRRLIISALQSMEYVWLAARGPKAGITLGTLHLIRASTDTIVEKLWGLSYYADSATRDWKSLIAFYKCLEIKPDLGMPEDVKEYFSSSAGMKIEAKNVRYRYDKKKEDVLKGMSFVINPGDMVAIVGYHLSHRD